ncbi:altronate dehydratase family protein [uncultured Pseudoteredinibacter sp.]|uniref:UxaA family hydrolase n=1 Tax=uncultured Pseudoteredinibacter sp. TaxID=1641701 RepID=UPI00262FC180|nr:altronate dehydratase family protein [uncultured Pseudoteredinibacter sp.]
MTQCIQLSATDNCVVALEDIAANSYIASFEITSKENISTGHKLASHDIPKGQSIIKYGQCIATATLDIKAGEHIHSHNCSMPEGPSSITPHTFESSDSTIAQARLAASKTIAAQFLGYKREYTKKIGTRNIVAVVAMVSCANSVVRGICQSAQQFMPQYNNVDALIPICHSGGCAVNQNGQSLELLQRTLRGWIYHPNIAAVLLVSLGCETNQVDQLLGSEACSQPQDRIQSLGIQACGGSHQAIREGLDKIKSLVAEANQAKRSEQGLEKLSVALQCGGSDAFSGLSANPALGRAVDILCSKGARAILAETPEIFGAEQQLYRRCRDTLTALKLEQKVHWWQQYAKQQGETLDSNPSHGNKAGGITTIIEKSLGAVAKAGKSTINNVYDYGEPMQSQGLVFMDSPGYDPVSITGQVASGANMICFTTGRGSNFNCPSVPSLKLASNQSIFNHMKDDLDINCGRLIDGEADLDSLAQEIVEKIIRTASGEPSKGEQIALFDDGFHPWSLGAVL